MATLIQDLLALPPQPNRPHPLLEQTFLPARAYTDPSLLPIEQEKILRRTWQYVGDGAQLQPGMVLATTVAGLSILISCDRQGQLHGFHNVCPHRASPFYREEGIQSCKHIVCPYHGWTYDLSGTLVGTPAKSRFPEGFNGSNFPLQAIRVEEWNGFLFASLDGDIPPLKDFLYPIPVEMNGYRQANTQRLAQQQYTIRCNWKNFHDNTLCDYHVAIAHRHTLHTLQGPIQHYEHHFWEYVNLLYSPTPQGWRNQNPVLPHLPERNRVGFYTYGIFPNLHFTALPNSVIGWIRIDPLTVESCRVTIDIFGIPEMVDSVEELAQAFKATTEEDVALTEGVQQGYQSGVYQAGIANGLEKRIIHHQKLYRHYLQR